MPKKSRSSGGRLSDDFDALVQELSRKGISVDEIAEDSRIKALFYKFKNPKQIALESLKSRIRLAIQRDRDAASGERNQVSIPGILDEPQHYEVADEITENMKKLAALELTCKLIRGHINNQKLMLPDEKKAIFDGIEEAEVMFQRRLA